MPAVRRTLAGPASVAGAGLFTARPATLTIRPAPAGHGVTFRRVDLPGSPLIRAHVRAVIDLPGLPPGMQARNTTLASAPGVFVTTTEHVLSALAGLGVTDAQIDLDGPETPILDGSAAPFTDAMRAAGVRDLDEPAGQLVLPREITLSAGPATLTATPRSEPGCELVYQLDYGPGSPIPAQQASITLGAPGAPEHYQAEVAPARTFCLAAEAAAMRSMGLFAHVTTRDMVVVGDDGQPIENRWRMAGEPARHKLLDLIGDLALAGFFPRARIVAQRAGHALNHAMARELVQAVAGPAAS